MKPKMCHLNYQPVTSLKTQTLDFDLLELEKINFSVKRDQMVVQLNQEQEINTPTFKYKKNKIQGAVKEIGNRFHHLLSNSPKKLIKSTRNLSKRQKEPLKNLKN
ncbi:unnamed protein product [Paramecium pentaurelia]|uniref:Uncharacterized protein n=1 Tax=Paramecium pentaurelia TaxID=43138 RepID=A0A8S1WC41_9CILI|nr:unnamed protein product [Paramecium pentaurelia]